MKLNISVQLTAVHSYLKLGKSFNFRMIPHEKRGKDSM